MLPDRKEWNEKLIRQLFYPFDADEICKLNIPSSDVDDQIAWHYEKSGVFSVRSAYKLAAAALSPMAQNPSSSSSEPNDRSIWDLIWKSKVPGKVRIFSWRVATNTLATKENKWKRTLELDNTCCICGNGTENEHHAVIRCTKSRALRRETLTDGSYGERLVAMAVDKWSPPELGMTKINTDTAFLAETGESAARIVGRDHQGLVLLSICRNLPRCQNAEEAEARAALVGLKAMAAHSNGQIVLELDNQVIANELNAPTLTRSLLSK
ncbi:uncharacterized protein [Aegilops tauschii subsp. strangulata]|uniref:uncharacterized protein n=1 Tax=Aegilops tauschii subsp. strangulata TaxID=200361 RepID=UPI003CC83B0E